MSQCPTCHGELTPDPANPQKLLCYNCKKRYDASAVDGYWAGQAQQAGGQQPYSSPYQPTQVQQPATPAQPYGAAQPATAPYAPAAAPQPAYGPPSYGGGQTQTPAYMQPPSKPGKGLAIAALVLGILAIPGAIIPILNVLAIILGVVALILGIIAAVKASKGTGGGMGFGIAGAICGVLAIIVSVAINVFAVNLIDDASNNRNWNVEEYVENLENGNFNANEFLNELNELSNELENTNSNTGAANGNSAPSNLTPPSVNETENSAPAPTAPVATGSGSANWLDMQITIDGYVVSLGQTTLSDLQANTKLSLDLEAAGYSNGYVVNPGSIVSAIFLDYEGVSSSAICMVSVENPTNQILDINDCIVKVIDFERPYKVSDPVPNVIAPGGLTFNASKEDVLAVYGDPQDRTESSEYSTFEYKDGNYTKYYEVHFDEHAHVDEFRMRLY